MPPLEAANQPLKVWPLFVGLEAGAVTDSPDTKLPDEIELPPRESKLTAYTSFGVTAFDAVEESELPTLFVAVTVKVSELFRVSPVT